VGKTVSPVLGKFSSSSQNATRDKISPVNELSTEQFIRIQNIGGRVIVRSMEPPEKSFLRKILPARAREARKKNIPSPFGTTTVNRELKFMTR
jgi:hypothetical protein